MTVAGEEHAPGRAGQPCDECVAMERKVLIAGVVAGVLMGAGAAILIARRTSA